MKINFKIQEKLKDGLLYAQKRNWVITVMIFLIVLVVAVVIWRDCTFNPQPSKATLSNILKIEQEYKTKMQNIEKNHQILKDQALRFNSPKKNLEDRDYFEPREEIDSSSYNYTSTTGNFNPEIVR